MNRFPALLLCVGAAVIGLEMAGCGGSGGGSSPSGGNQPSAKTVSDVTAHVAGLGQGVVVNSFRGYGTNVQSSVVAFDSILGLWGSATVAPDILRKNFYLDQTRKTAAGSFDYTVSDATFTTSGSIQVSSGRCSGLTGTYNQALVSGSGINGSTVFSIPNVSTVDHQFSVTLTGAIAAGTGSTAVALQSGYTQNEKIVFNSDGTTSITTTDANSCKSSLTLASDYSGSGTLTGSDPGLPATFNWDQTGTGMVKFSNGAELPVTDWQVSGAIS